MFYKSVCVCLFRAEAGSCNIHVYDGRGSEVMETLQRLHSQPVVIIRVCNYSTSHLLRGTLSDVGGWTLGEVKMTFTLNFQIRKNDHEQNKKQG